MIAAHPNSNIVALDLGTRNFSAMMTLTKYLKLRKTKTFPGGWEKMLIPCNSRDHWTAILIDVSDSGGLYYFDPFGRYPSSDYDIQIPLESSVFLLWQYLMNWVLSTKQKRMNEKPLFTYINYVRRQTCVVQCGVFVLEFFRKMLDGMSFIDIVTDESFTSKACELKRQYYFGPPNKTQQRLTKGEQPAMENKQLAAAKKQISFSDSEKAAIHEFIKRAGEEPFFSFKSSSLNLKDLSRLRQSLSSENKIHKIQKLVCQCAKENNNKAFNALSFLTGIAVYLNSAKCLQVSKSSSSSSTAIEKPKAKK